MRIFFLQNFEKRKAYQGFLLLILIELFYNLVLLLLLYLIEI